MCLSKPPVQICDFLCESSLIEAILEEFNNGWWHWGKQDLDIIKIINEIINWVLLTVHSDFHKTFSEARALKVQTFLQDRLETTVTSFDLVGGDA